MTAEHPFAQFVRIIGKGPHLSRPLTESEMYDAARMILAGEVEPVQLGAFLCVLRVRSEEAEEGAGFTRAVRDSLELPADPPPVDLDWPTYSGKARQLPWFLLSALLLADNGIRVFMHGTEGHTAGRVYAREALEHLGVRAAGSLAEAAQQVSERGFAYLSLKDMAPRLQDIIDLKPILGLRSPVNTFARMINPFGAPYQVQGTFHPAYRDIHRDTAQVLAQPHMCVFKGDGGEVERRPQKPVQVLSLHDGELLEEEWPPMLPEEAVKEDSDMNPARLPAVWNGAEVDEYATHAVVGTTAIILRLMGKAANPKEAFDRAKRMWDTRRRERFAA